MLPPSFATSSAVKSRFGLSVLLVKRGDTTGKEEDNAFSEAGPIFQALEIEENESGTHLR